METYNRAYVSAASFTLWSANVLMQLHGVLLYIFKEPFHYAGKEMTNVFITNIILNIQYCPKV